MREFILFCSIFVGNWNWERATKIRLSTGDEHGNIFDPMVLVLVAEKRRKWAWRPKLPSLLPNKLHVGSMRWFSRQILLSIWIGAELRSFAFSSHFWPFRAGLLGRIPILFHRLFSMGIEKGKNVNPTFETHGKMQSICQHWAAVLFWRMMCVDLKRRYQKWHLIAANRQTTTHLTILNACLVKWVLACFWFNLWQSVTQ